MLGTHIVDTHKLEPRWFQEENDLFTRKCHEEVGRQNVRRLWWLKHSSTCIWSPRPQIVRNFNGPMSLFTVKDFPYTSFIARLFKIRIFESFMEMRPPIFGVIWLCDAATRFLKASPPHLTLRMQFLDSTLSFTGSQIYLAILENMKINAFLLHPTLCLCSFVVLTYDAV